MLTSTKAREKLESVAVCIAVTYSEETKSMHGVGNGKGEIYSSWKACYILLFS